jgi:protein-serine/threonine kinase
MAPELIRGEQYDAKIDCWSTGIILHELATGDPPYMQFPALKALVLITQKGIPPINTPAPNKQPWSPSMMHFTSLCLMMEPKMRATSSQLLQHQFIKKQCSPDEFIRFVNDIRAKKGLKN